MRRETENRAHHCRTAFLSLLFEVEDLPAMDTHRVFGQRLSGILRVRNTRIGHRLGGSGRCEASSTTFACIAIILPGISEDSCRSGEGDCGPRTRPHWLNGGTMGARQTCGDVPVPGLVFVDIERKKKRPAYDAGPGRPGRSACAQELRAVQFDRYILRNA